MQGVTIDKILDDIRDNVFETGLQWEHLTSKQDIINIKRQYNIEGIQRHQNDQTSVTSWVEEMESMEFNPVLAFKPQGSDSTEEGVKKEDFLLVIQTQYQMEVLKTFGGNVVCMDATHGTNIYDFYLVTIVVIDEYGEGIPVAWAITSREDVYMLSFFASLYRRELVHSLQQFLCQMMLCNIGMLG